MIVVGVLLHMPMLVEAHRMGNHLAGMGADPAMLAGMALILTGVPLAIFGALPRRNAVYAAGEVPLFEAPDSTPLGLAHAYVILVLILGLVIDVMKPATLGFVLPGLSREYGLASGSAAWLPLIALTGTAIGSYLWGWLADAYGRRVSIILSTVLFISTSICGAMPDFRLNLLMCLMMGMSAGGMLPVVYTLLAEIMPPRHRSWVLVLVGGIGLVGGFLAASAAAHLFEAQFGWRFLWLQGFPTGLLLLALARFIPESPRFLHLRGRRAELASMEVRFGIVAQPSRLVAPTLGLGVDRRLTLALVIAALGWSVVNFGLLLWLPAQLQARGYSSSLASGIIASSALLALPTIALVAWLYSRWSSKGTLVATIVILLAGLAGASLPAGWLAEPPVLVAAIALLVLGTNGMIAVILPYAAEIYPAATRGQGTGLIAGGSKIGGVGVQLVALGGVLPTLGLAALSLTIPLAIAALLILAFGLETRGRPLADELRTSPG